MVQDFADALLRATRGKCKEPGGEIRKRGLDLGFRV